jgi:hypothetical protein
LLLGPESAVASVSVDDVRDVINVSSAEVPDSKVMKMIKHAKGVPALLDFLDLFSGYRQTSGNLLATVWESKADFRLNQTWIFGLFRK